jgi:hypothetical protein
VFGIVALNELIAPVLFRIALVRSGEAGGRHRAGPDGGSPSSQEEPAGIEEIEEIEVETTPVPEGAS